MSKRKFTGITVLRNKYNPNRLTVVKRNADRHYFVNQLIINPHNNSVTMAYKHWARLPLQDIANTSTVPRPLIELLYTEEDLLKLWPKVVKWSDVPNLTGFSLRGAESDKVYGVKLNHTTYIHKSGRIMNISTNSDTDVRIHVLECDL